MDAKLRKSPVVASLLVEGRASLADWYAGPLAQGAAEVLHTGAGQALQQCLRAGRSCFQLQVLQLLCRFWMAGAIAPDYAQLLVAAAGDRERALLELVYGQLLVSCKRRPAQRHLERGFALAAPQLAATDYLRVVRRHELLGHLCLSDIPSPPMDLDALLAEAAVIRRLQAGTRREYRYEHLDTVG